MENIYQCAEKPGNFKSWSSFPLRLNFVTNSRFLGMPRSLCLLMIIILSMFHAVCVVRYPDHGGYSKSHIIVNKNVSRVKVLEMKTELVLSRQLNHARDDAFVTLLSVFS